MRSLIIGFIVLTAITCNSAHAQWVQTNGPFGDNIAAIAVSGPNLFAGTARGVYRSTDDGTSWSIANFGRGIIQVDNITGNDADLFAWAHNASNGFIYRSTDNGSSWAEMKSFFPPSAGSIVLNGSNAFAVNNGDVYVSTDSGINWNQEYPDLEGKDVWTFATLGANFIAGSDHGVFLSTNEGSSWNQVINGLTDTVVYAFCTEGQRLLASTPHGVFLSTNNGANWSEVCTEYFPTFAQIGNMLFGGGASGVYVSDDSGSTWNLASNTGFDASKVNALTVINSDLIAATDSSVFLSSDNATNWVGARTGLPWTVNVTTLTGNDTNVFAGTENNGIYRSTDNGLHWTIAGNFPINMYVYAIGVNGATIFGATDFALYVSTNSGTSWVAAENGLPMTPVVYGFAFVGNHVFAGMNNGVYVSDNNGANWDFAGLSKSKINALTNMGDWVIAGSNAGIVSRSINNGTTWESSNNSLPSYSISAFAVNGTMLFVGTDSGVFYSKDTGINWVPAGLQDTMIYSLVCSDSKLFAGTISGVFLSTDDGASWNLVDTGLVGTFVFGVAKSGTNLIAGDNTSGLWLRPLSDFDFSAVSSQQITSSNAVTAYPNPFSNMATINFSSEYAGYAEITIVNLLGTRVAQIFSGELGPGVHEFSWEVNRTNDRPMAPGMYECMARINGTVQTIPLLLTK